MKKKLSILVAGVLLSISTYVAADTIYCWSMTCQVCSAGGCGPQFKAPDGICDVPGVVCPTGDIGQP